MTGKLRTDPALSSESYSRGEGGGRGEGRPPKLWRGGEFQLTLLASDLNEDTGHNILNVVVTGKKLRGHSILICFNKHKKIVETSTLKI